MGHHTKGKEEDPSSKSPRLGQSGRIPGVSATPLGGSKGSIPQIGTRGEDDVAAALAAATKKADEAAAAKKKAADEAAAKKKAEEEAAAAAAKKKAEEDAKKKAAAESKVGWSVVPFVILNLIPFPAPTGPTGSYEKMCQLQGSCPCHGNFLYQVWEQAGICCTCKKYPNA